MNFDPKGKEGGTLTLRNPHGIEKAEDSKTQGTFKISLKTYKKLFCCEIQESH